MLVRAQAVRPIIRALARESIPVEAVLREAGIDPTVLEDGAARLPWSRFVRLCDAIAAAVHGDVDRLRALGAVLASADGSESVLRLAKTVVSARRLYDLAFRWAVPSSFPHLLVFVSGGPRRQLSLRVVIPSAHQPCAPFLEIAVGGLVALPTTLGLPPCVILESRITDRTLELDLELPQERRGVFRSLEAVARLRTRAHVLEEQRRALVEALAASRRTGDELRTVLEHLPDMVVIHVAGRIVFVNRAFAHTLGWDAPQELVGRSLVDLVDPRSRGVFLKRMAQPVDAPGLPEVTEAWLLTRAGEPIRVEVSPTHEVVFDGRKSRVVVGRDVRERERMQNRLASADRLASLGLLAAGVAHEVNNPLSYVLNNIEIARRQLGRLGPEAALANDALQIALEGVDRIRFIVHELLQLSRAEPAGPTATDLAGVVQSTLALANLEVERTATLRVELTPVPLVRGSVPRIAQIVLNLVLNALEAMRGRPRDANVLVVRVAPTGTERVLLEVTDTGVGVKPSDAARVFDPFFTTKEGGKGTGLGLSITQRLVNDLGGEISFTSEPGLGTSFRVSFPIAADDAIGAVGQDLS